MKSFRAARRWRGWSLVWRMRNSNSRPGLLQAAASKSEHGHIGGRPGPCYARICADAVLGRCSFGPWIAALPLDGILGTQ